MTGDAAFRPELSLLAWDAGCPVGVIVCAHGRIVRMGVVPEWRARGLGSALITEVLRGARAAGGDQVLLDVNVPNPSAARVYTRLGFSVAGRRARFGRMLP